MEDILYPFLSLYNNLPVFIKNNFGYIYNRIPNSIRYGRFFNTYLKRIDYFTNLLGNEEKEKEQLKILLSTTNFAIKKIPFYKNFDFCKSKQEFENLPIITKEIINNYKKDFINSKLLRKGLKVNTGGSSGTPLEFYLCKGVSRAKEHAHFIWYWSQFGYRRGDKILIVRGKPLKRGIYEYSAIDNKFLISLYNINEENIRFIHNKLEQFAPKFIHAYPSALKILVSLFLESKLIFESNIKAIFLGSEYLPKEDKILFENYFNAKVVNWYGHSECLIHGGSCLYSDEYHFFPFYGYLELVDEENNVIKNENQLGRIVATGFDNLVMPFIRYDTGDLGYLSNSSECQCGFKGTSLNRIEGRHGDIIILADLTKVTLTAFIFGQHLKAFKAIREFQIIQEKVGEITLRIVRTTNYNENTESELKKTLLKAVSFKLLIFFEYVNYLEKTHRGKNKFLIQKLDIK